MSYWTNMAPPKYRYSRTMHEISWEEYAGTRANLPNPIPDERRPQRIWCSRDYLAMLYTFEPAPRLSILRTEWHNGTWRDGITWDELERVKNETVGTHIWAVEIYPAANETVNAHNIRHLWLLDQPPAFAWLNHTGE